MQKIGQEFEYLSDIFIGRQPGWLVRSGTGMMFFVFTILFGAAFFIRYPDVIVGRAILTTEVPSIPIKAKSSALIEDISAVDGDIVSSGQKIMILANESDLREVEQLEKILNNIDILLHDDSITVDFPALHKLGSLQPHYNALKEVYSEKLNYLAYTDVQLRIKEEQDLQEIYERELLIKKSSLELQAQKLEVLSRRVDNYRSLIKNNLVERTLLEKALEEQIDSQLMLKVVEVEINDIEQQQTKSRNYVQRMNKTHLEKVGLLRKEIQSSIQSIRNSLNEWRYNFVLSSPLNGEVLMNHIWSNNQYANEGDTLFHILPNNHGDIIAKVEVSPEGVGKIEIGQNVFIELDGYPASQYGQLQGKVIAISKITFAGKYLVDVNLANPRLTNFNQPLAYSPELGGSGHIITSERSLISRFFEQLSYIVTKHQAK